MMLSLQVSLSPSLRSERNIEGIIFENRDVTRWRQIRLYWSDAIFSGVSGEYKGKRNGMKLKYDYSFQKYDDRYLAVVDFLSTSDERRIIWVNACGKTIMEMLHNEMTREELLRALNEKYSGDPAVIANTVDAFLKQLSDADLLISM